MSRSFPTISTLRLAALALPALIILLSLTACDLGDLAKQEIGVTGVTAGIPNPAIDSYPAWSPDGTVIAFYHHGVTYASYAERGYIIHPDSVGIWFIAPDGSDKRMFLQGGRNPAWGPQGKKLVFNSGQQIFKIMANGDGLTQLTFEGRNFFPAISPDGNSIVYDSNLDDTKYDVWLMLIDGKNKRNISLTGASTQVEPGRRPRWSPDGNKIIHERFDANTNAETDIYTMDTGGAQSKFLGPGSTARYSPDGRQITFAYDSNIWVMDNTGKNQVKLTSDLGFEPSWSPDGQHIVYGGPEHTLWIMESDGRNKRQFTFKPDSL